MGCVSVPQSKPAAFTDTEFLEQRKKHSLNCLSLSKADMEFMYIFSVTRGFERLQENHQDIIFNKQKKSLWKKKISTAQKYQCGNQEPATYLTYTEAAE